MKTAVAILREDMYPASARPAMIESTDVRGDCGLVAKVNGGFFLIVSSLAGDAPVAQVERRQGWLERLGVV